MIRSSCVGVYHVCAVLFLSLAALAGPLRADVVRVGVATENFPPFLFTDEAGNLTGWEIELMEALCAEAEADCVTKTAPFGQLINMLLADEIDVIGSSLSITRERAGIIAFSEPYYRAMPLIVARKGGDIHSDGRGMGGMTLGVMRGTNHHSYATRYFSPMGVRIIAFADQIAVNQALAAGEVDAIQGDSGAMYKFTQTELGRCCEIKGTVPDNPLLGSGVGLGLRKSDQVLRDRFNAAISAVITNGTRDKITARYFEVPIY